QGIQRRVGAQVGAGIARMRRREGLAADISEVEGGGTSGGAAEAVEAVRSDGPEEVEARGPVRVHRDRMVMRREADGAVDVTRQRVAGDGCGAFPELAAGHSGERAVAGE